MVAEKTGWTYHYILHRIAWVNIRMMLADAPGYRTDIPEHAGSPSDATDTDLQTLAHTINGR